MVGLLQMLIKSASKQLQLLTYFLPDFLSTLVIKRLKN